MAISSILTEDREVRSPVKEKDEREAMASF